MNNKFLYEKVSKALKENKTNHEIVMEIGCSSSYVRFVRRKMNDPQKTKIKSESQKITAAWKKQFSDDWENAVRNLW